MCSCLFEKLMSWRRLNISVNCHSLESVDNFLISSVVPWCNSYSGHCGVSGHGDAASLARLAAATLSAGLGLFWLGVCRRGAHQRRWAIPFLVLLVLINFHFISLCRVLPKLPNWCSEFSSCRSCTLEISGDWTHPARRGNSNFKVYYCHLCMSLCNYCLLGILAFLFILYLQVLWLDVFLD